MFPRSRLNHSLVVILISAKGQGPYPQFPTMSYHRNGTPSYLNKRRIRMVTINPTFQYMNVFKDIMERPTLRAMSLLTTPIQDNRRVITMNATAKATFRIRYPVKVVSRMDMEHQHMVVLSIEPRVIIARPKTYFLPQQGNGYLYKGRTGSTCHTRGHHRRPRRTTTIISVYLSRRVVLAFFVISYVGGKRHCSPSSNSLSSVLSSGSSSRECSISPGTSSKSGPSPCPPSSGSSSSSTDYFKHAVFA